MKFPEEGYVHPLCHPGRVFRRYCTIKPCRAGAEPFCDITLPIPDVILDGLFDMTADVFKYVGHYVLFRHDKEGGPGQDVYLQTCARISASDLDLLVYEDFAVGNTDRISYEGHIYLVGSIINIVGQSKMLGRASRAELWWAGLKVGSAESNDQARILYGYVSDLTSSGLLYTDRLVLLRLEEDRWREVRDRKHSTISEADVRKQIGDAFMDFLHHWRDVEIDEPLLEFRAE